jgi:uncharacterized membrane protein YgaE (UPF0421/DUF939 family)
VRVLCLRAGGRRLRGWSLSAAAQRVRGVFAPVLQTSLAAGLAWYVTHDLLGHAHPFFAPIAATVALSTSHVQRSRRSVQMMVGVLLGIGVSELLHPLVGDGAVSIGVVVFVTLLLAVAIGIGFVGEGMMFFNQAGASAVLVIALHRAGTGGERAIDALVGGGVALVVGVGLFPADPMKVLWSAESQVLRALVRILERRPPPAEERAETDPDMDAALAASHDVHRRLTTLTLARGTARTCVRVAPRRFSMRSAVEREEMRVARLYLLASAALNLMRAMGEIEEHAAAPALERVSEADDVARCLEMLLDAPRPWPRRIVAQVLAQMRALVQRPLPSGPAQGADVAGAARRLAGEIILLMPDTPAPRG